jgi:hypothetical protein
VTDAGLPLRMLPDGSDSLSRLAATSWEPDAALPPLRCPPRRVRWLESGPPGPVRRQSGPALRPSRAVRRVLLVLLSGASNLDVFTVAALARIRASRSAVILARMEEIGWAVRERELDAAPDPGQRVFCRLTAFSRCWALALLGLQEGPR